MLAEDLQVLAKVAGVQKVIPFHFGATYKDLEKRKELFKICSGELENQEPILIHDPVIEPILFL